MDDLDFLKRENAAVWAMMEELRRQHLESHGLEEDAARARANVLNNIAKNFVRSQIYAAINLPAKP